MYMDLKFTCCLLAFARKFIFCFGNHIEPTECDNEKNDFSIIIFFSTVVVLVLRLFVFLIDRPTTDSPFRYYDPFVIHTKAIGIKFVSQFRRFVYTNYGKCFASFLFSFFTLAIRRPEERRREKYYVYEFFGEMKPYRK